MDYPKRTASAGLPEDSLLEILARLPARSVYRSKCVAKAWRDLIEDPLNRKNLPQTLQGFFFFFIENDDGGMDIRFTNLRAGSAPLQIDPSLSFLKYSPGIQILTFLDSCNGLLLFEHKEKQRLNVLGYVVCNPATKQWVEVPIEEYVPPLKIYNYLVFDPSVSSHFHLVQFKWQFGDLAVSDDDEENEDNDDDEEQLSRTSVHLYSSETGKWTHMQSDRYKHVLQGWHLQGFVPQQSCLWAVLNSMLHFIIWGQDQIAVVDVQGVTRKIIPVPTMAERNHWSNPCYVAQSQGRLHYINQSDAQLSIWVLENYDTQNWVLKHTVSFTELFRKRSHTCSKHHYSVVAMHPDGNVVFIVEDEN